jgi:hypothetical protein
MKITHYTYGANAHIIRFNFNSIALFSYETLVCFIDGKTKYVDEHNYSSTTNRHIAKFSDHQFPVEYVSQAELQKKLQTFMAYEVLEMFDRELL